MQVSDEIKQRPNYKPYTDPAEARGRNHLPEPVGDEKAYILRVKKDAPFSTVSVMSLSFHKVLRSRPDSEGQQKDVCMIKYLADNQLEAVRLVAEKKMIKRLDNSTRLSALEMIDLEELPAGEYDELMNIDLLPQAILASAIKQPETAEEIKAAMEKMEAKLKEIEEAGKEQKAIEEEAKEESEKDEDEEKAKKKPKRKRR